MELTITEIAQTPQTPPTIYDSIYHTLESVPQSYHKIMFYFDLDWEDPKIDETVVCLFKEYFWCYVLARETSESGVKHYQAFVIDKNLQKYTNFIQRLKNKYKLCGRAKKGGRRQYGKTKDKLKDPLNALIYTLKEKNYEYKHFSAEYMAQLEKCSFKKPSSVHDLYEKLIEDIKARLQEIEEVWEKECESITSYDDVWKRKCIAIVEACYAHNGKLPARAQILNLAFKLGALSSASYVDMLKL